MLGGVSAVVLLVTLAAGLSLRKVVLAATVGNGGKMPQPGLIKPEAKPHDAKACASW
ncbi:MAG: hypothetical protein NTX35_01840 [Verrucomicrobia bacterium]|nr:hypothetical protein [Verrucomicrobiota bacterium]